MTKNYFTAQFYGMCGGVHAALKTLEELLNSSGQKVFVLHELVHNRTVTDSFKQKGVVFAESIEEIPPGSPVVIGAHGVTPDVEQKLRLRAGVCRDATCPLVKKLHNIAKSLTAEDQLIIFGKSGHPEVDGVTGHSRAGKIFLISSPEEALALPELPRPVFISQTTVAHDESEKTLEILKKRFGNLRECAGICDASRLRQQAVRELAAKVDCVIVIGSRHSSNAKRLCEVAQHAGCDAYLIENAGELTPQILQYSRIGVSSGASTPQILFDEVISALNANGFVNGI